MKKKALLLGIILILLVSGGCAQAEEGTEVERTETQADLQIGMSFDSFVIERWQRDRDVFVSTAKELGAEVNVQNANGNLEEQIAQIEYFIDKKMDVIVIICIDSDGLGDVVQKAKNAGIKIIAYDRLIKNAGVDLYISFDNEMVGAMMGEGIVSKGGEVENVLMLGGPLADNNVSLVERGFERVMREHGIHILDRMHADGWKAELGAEYVYDHVDMVERADAIMCGNDDIATAVFRALSEKRLAGKIGVVGQDADLAACQRIVQGTQIMTVYKPVEKLAQRAAECAIALGKGEAVAAETVIDDGSFQVPYVALAPISVYKENMDDVVVNSGFHLKEDVYLNIPAGRETEEKEEEPGQEAESGGEEPGQEAERSGGEPGQKAERSGEEPGQEAESGGEEPGQETGRGGGELGQETGRSGEEPGQETGRSGGEPGQETGRSEEASGGEA